jgi:hypothetical protein
MSAPGIQLNSEPHLPQVQPTVRQYLQSIKDAVASNNLSAAQQAFAQLTKALPFPAQATSGETNEFATHISQGMQALGQALETGDLAAAQQAVGGLRTNMPSVPDAQAQRQSVATEPASEIGSDVSSEDGSSAGPNLNVRA